MDSPVAQGVDIGTALSYPTKDPDWIKKCGLAGLMILIPVVGPIMLMGWQRNVYERVVSGDPSGLPDLNLGEDLSKGIAPFVAVLTLALPLFGLLLLMAVCMGVVGALGGVVGEDVAGILAGVIGLVFGLLSMVVSLVMAAVIPEVLRRGFNGEMAPILSPGKSIRAVRSSPKDYAMAFGGNLVGQFVGGLGTMLCYVGMFLTLPLGHSMSANALAQWQRVLSANGLE